jgi:kynurenine formamidase
MRLIDLTHVIDPQMQVFPGTKPPQLQHEGKVSMDGYTVTTVTLQNHIGTHMDAPAHMVEGGLTLDQMPVATFYGTAVMIDARNSVGEIEVSQLKKDESIIAQSDFVVLFTGWSRYFGEETYFGRFPVLSNEAAMWLTQFKLKGVAMDTISVDPMESKDFINHKILLNHGFVVVENLKNLDAIKQKTCILSMMPLHFVKSDGAPIRAMAILE